MGGAVMETVGSLEEEQDGDIGMAQGMHSWVVLGGGWRTDPRQTAMCLSPCLWHGMAYVSLACNNKQQLFAFSLLFLTTTFAFICKSITFCLQKLPHAAFL